MSMKWVVVYGFGTPSAYVDRVGDEGVARRHLVLRQNMWPEYSRRFSMRPFADVVRRVVGDGFVLTKSALGRDKKR